MDTLKIYQELEARSLTGDSNKESKGGGSNYGDPPCSEAPQGATGQNPQLPGTGETPASQGEHLLSGTYNAENLEVLTEKADTLVLRGGNKNRSGAS